MTATLPVVPVENDENTKNNKKNNKRKMKTVAAKIIDEELHHLKKKYYASASGRSLKETISSKKDISDKKTRGKFERAMELDESAALENARRERYLSMEPSGVLEAETEKGERTWRFQQSEIIAHVDVNAKKKAFDLRLEGSGPYRSVDFSPNGQHLVIGGSGDGGHVANVEWNKHKLLSEIYLDENKDDENMREVGVIPAVKCVN